MSTAEVYRICVPRTVPAEVWVNDLQAPAVKLHPEIARTLGALVAVGAADVRMSGSGATCFGFASDEDAADKMSAALNVRGLRAYSVCTLGPKV